MLKKIVSICVTGLVIGIFASCDSAPQNGPRSSRMACRANLRTLASQQMIYFAENDSFSSSVSELGFGDLGCPENDEQYIITAEGDLHFSIICPCGHGGVIDGEQNWE